MTVKEWSSFEKAKSYIGRFARVPWFAGASLESTDGRVLYERTSAQSVYFYDTSMANFAGALTKNATKKSVRVGRAHGKRLERRVG